MRWTISHDPSPDTQNVTEEAGEPLQWSSSSSSSSFVVLILIVVVVLRVVVEVVLKSADKKKLMSKSKERNKTRENLPIWNVHNMFLLQVSLS